ncbi:MULTISPECIES: hypothetical protein [Klebsiella pneumoniae complex]|nr:MULTISPECIES: hypothetical protein [Klebsiella]HBQ6506180.1 hypothetical protein [Klebsiella variicola subsp. variicola]EIY5129781.1 hypothetical protein [Klebsiella variicola]MBN7739612.1 hypothetical protein [Klebsiella variicola]MCH6139523.1 hypothetical protein [Klebsiella variicola]MCH6175602.1 hypothetical protein [Klebsiella variicola]
MRLKINELSICALKIKAPPTTAAHHRNATILLAKLTEQRFPF